MNYRSTRNSGLSVTSAEAIARGISADGGLFVPESIPSFSKEDFKAIGEMDYIEAAVYVLKQYLTDYTEQELFECAEGAYSGTFEYEEPAPLAELCPNVFMLEATPIAWSCGTVPPVPLRILRFRYCPSCLPRLPIRPKKVRQRSYLWPPREIPERRRLKGLRMCRVLKFSPSIPRTGSAPCKSCK